MAVTAKKAHYRFIEMNHIRDIGMQTYQSTTQNQDPRIKTKR